MSSDGRLSPFVRAVMAALRFDCPDTSALSALPRSEWERALEFTDSSQLTLALYKVAADALPSDVADRIRGDMERNRIRTSRVLAAYDQIAKALESAHLHPIVLKGFTLIPDFCPDLEGRVQYDIDLMLSPQDARVAATVLTHIGYQAVDGTEEFPTDHLPTMTRKTGWMWRGDYFDPEIPVMVDLHFRFWDEETERISLPELEAFRERAVQQRLHQVDALGYFCLHLLRHLLRGSLKPANVYELAYFLENKRDDASFWREWELLHFGKLRLLEALCFALAHSWFGPRMSAQAACAVDRLPQDLRGWIERFGMKPLESRFHANKSEVLLHLLLLDSWSSRIAVLRRRLLPGRLPGPVDAVCIPAADLTWRIRARAALRYVAYVGERVAYHFRAGPSFAADVAHWVLRSGGIRKDFWVLLAASSLFDVGMYVFVVLYNLFLLERGYTPEHLGWIASAMTVGSIAGTLPAAWIARRIGLRPTVMLAFGGTAGLSALRATLPGIGPILLSSFFSGALFALWAVSIAPAVAGLTSEERRARAFSIFFSTGILLGIPTGWLAGRLPEWIGTGKQGALLAACAVAASALIPASRLRLQAPRVQPIATYPKGQFVVRFLFAFSVWNLGTGAFNPFFNAYFAVRHNAEAQFIGSAFSIAQAVQIFTLLAAPVVLHRLGLARGVASMMAATALGLVFLAAAPNRMIAVTAYATYMGFQWMSGPGINTLLMNRVSPEQRAGASSLYYLTAFCAQAGAAAGAGAWVSRNGFVPVLLTASALSVAAALMFRRLATEPQSHGLALPSPRSIPESAS